MQADPGGEIGGPWIGKDPWRTFAVFKNQGDCVSWVATNGRNEPAG